MATATREKLFHTYDFSSDVCEAVPPQKPRRSRATRHRPLANRSTRLVACMLDGLVGFVLVYPFLINLVLSSVGGQNEFSAPWVVGGLVGLMAFNVFQLVMLVTCGQTFGKWAMQIRIARVEDGMNPGFVRVILLRNSPLGLLTTALAFVPVTGAAIVPIVLDTLLFFRRDRRAFHDHLAGTVVVKV